MSFAPELLQQATQVLAAARAKGLKIATAESCTGGLISSVLTEVAGSSDVFERGFVTYSYLSKTQLLGVSQALLSREGAVNGETARQMAEGALANSDADAVVAVTGIAGPGGGSAGKPVGLVYMAALRKGGRVELQEHRFGDIGREQVRLATVKAALALLANQL